MKVLSRFETRNLRRDLITAVSGLALAAVSAAPAAAEDETVEEITVTATRIRASGFEAPTPTTVMSREDIEKLGITNVGQLTFQMPQFVGSESPQNSMVRSGGSGNAFNLRALTSTRTLFLLNSKRHVPNNPNGTTDNNVVPSSIIERVEVVTGGASAAWGSDAVAGVVNVILKEVEGFEGEVSGGVTLHGDNRLIKTSAAWGTKFADDRGYFMISGEVEDNDGVTAQGDRDWGRRGMGLIPNPTFTPTNGQFARLTVQNARVNNATYGGLIVSGVLAGTQFTNAGPIRYNSGAYPVGTAATVGGDGPDLAALLNILVPLQRKNVYSKLSYEVSENAKIYVEGTYGESESKYGLINNFNFGNITINQDNAYLPAALRTTMLAAGQNSFNMGRINSDFGLIREDLDNETRRVVVGADGDFGNDWTWSAYYQYGKNDEQFYERGIVRPANYNLAADAVIGPNGQIVCRSSIANPTNGCVPINLFGSGSPSAQAIAYVTGTVDRLTKFRENVVSANVGGPLFDLWAGPVQVAAGAEYRKDKLNRAVDPISQANGFLIGNPKNIVGELSVTEVFGELAIPLVSDAPFAKSLDLNFADRYVDYSTTGGVNTWKAGLNYEINDQVRVRFARSRDIRAPNALELFSFGGTQFASISDPQNGGRIDTQVALIQTPNPALKPEKANTTTVGVVFSPDFVPGLRLSIDHYNINIHGAIVSIPAQDIVNRCAAGNQALCAAIIRNATGNITRVEAGRVNLQNLITSGFDFEAVYTTPVGAGDLTLRALANYVDKNITDDGRTKLDKAGKVFDGVPHWRATGSIVYSLDNLTLISNLRWVGGGAYSATFAPIDLDVQSFSGRFYADLGAEYTLSDKQVQLFGKVNNVFDRAPPFISGSQVPFPYTNYQYYDGVGRTFLAGVRFKY
ncbi:MAG: TonB-dependent receptor [Rhodospirillaceae bacterium]|nr:TonB-dependent receptor [Rhodospirillaceae bacterium]